VQKFNFVKRLLFLLIAQLFLLASNYAYAYANSTPNIILIVAEDMSAHVNAFGDNIAKTPNIDALAKQGVRYPNTFTTAGVCAPSRTSLITGVHQITIGGQHMRTRNFIPHPYRAVPDRDVKAFPEILRQHGYYTFVSNKLDYQFSNITKNTGPFTIWDQQSKQPTWRTRPKNKPFFGMYHLDITHESQLFPTKIEKNLKSNKVSVVTLPEQVSVPPFLPDTLVIRETIAQLYNNVHAMDKLVGKIVDDLRTDNLLNNTIIIWTTDHGDGLPRAKREIYDSGIKVPLVVFWPEKYRPKQLLPNSIDKQLISFVDLAPSILAMANINKPAFMQGEALLVDYDLSPRQYIFAAKDRLDEVTFKERAVRSTQFKYIKNYLPNLPGGIRLKYREQLPVMADVWQAIDEKKLNSNQLAWYLPRPTEELYNIEVDPFELNNLATLARHQDTLLIMRAALTKFKVRVPDLSDISEIRLAKRNWPNKKQPVTSPPKIKRLANKVMLTNSTDGASIGFQLNQEPWQLYVKPFDVKESDHLNVKAVKYGWQESSVKQITIIIEE